MSYLSSGPLSICTSSIEDYQIFSLWSPRATITSPNASSGTGWSKRPLTKIQNYYGNSPNEYLPRENTPFAMERPISAAQYFCFNQTQPKTRLLCRYCFDNRQAESIYTSHNQFNTNGQLICPILKVVYSKSPPTSPKNTQKTTLPLRSQALDPNERNELLKNAQKHPEKNGKCKRQWCIFCKNNNEPDEIYKSHVLKDSNGKTTCPILQKHTCPICQATGEQAHTITYCKEFKKNSRQKVLTKLSKIANFF